MQKERPFTLTANGKDYTLSVGEYIGTKTAKVMLRAELRGDGKTALFLLVIDPIWASVRAASTSQD